MDTTTTDSVTIPESWREATRLLAISTSCEHRAREDACLQNASLAAAWLSLAGLAARHAVAKLGEAQAALTKSEGEGEDCDVIHTPECRSV